VGGIWSWMVRGNRLCGNWRYFNFELRGRKAITAETQRTQRKAKDLTQRRRRKGGEHRERLDRDKRYRGETDKNEDAKVLRSGR
jgi:hypothetical protein